MRYSEEQIQTALRLLDKTGSPKVVIQALGYPSRQMLYHWKKAYKPIRHRRSWRHASYELKLTTIHRCFDNGEPVQLIAEEIGYSVSAIYIWYRKYRQKGPSALMKKQSSNPSQNEEISKEELAALKAQMHVQTGNWHTRIH